MFVTHDLTIDLVKRNCYPMLSAVQGEGSTRQLAISLLSNGKAWDVPAGVTAAVAFLKSDGTNGLYDKLPDDSNATAIAGSTVTAVLAPQVLTCAGTVMVSIIFYDNEGDTLATFPFPIMVEKNPTACDEVSNNYYALQNLEQANEAYNKLLAQLDEFLSLSGGTLTKVFTKNSLISGAFVRFEDGVAESNSNYLRTESIVIPSDCEVIVHDFPFSATGIDGWAVYDADGVYITGGKDTEFTVPDGAKSIMLSYRGSNTADANITFYSASAVALQKITEELEATKTQLNELVNKDALVTQTFKKDELISGAFIQYADGVVKSNSNYLRTDSIDIPETCHTITHSFPMSETGTDGWAVYDISGAFVSGGKETMFSVPNNARTIMLSYKNSEEGDAAITFWPGSKKIAFMGDSVTYGASPDDANDVDGDERLERPWPETVGQLLKTPTINLGKNSATLMEGTTYSGNPTPLALVRDYVNYSDDYDVVGFMIGINDLYRSALNIEGSPYTLGTMEDRTADTFYGALHVFIKGMVAKYPPLDHKVFAMIYPYYHGNDTNRERVPLYFNAIREVARYYSLPVLDLEAELGVNVLSDPGLANGTDGVYWVKETNSHPTQAGADLIAQVVANFINTRFLLESAAGGTDGKGYVLTEDDKTDIAEKVEIPGGEVWIFELEDGSTVTKEVVVK